MHGREFGLDMTLLDAQPSNRVEPPPKPKRR
jgi:hypothetical protein